MKINVKFSEGTLFLLEQLQQYTGLLEPALERAMRNSTRIIYDNIVDREIPRFRNATGGFEDSLHTWVDGPYQAQVWSDVPYAQRLNYGFSGQTDALGRFYPYWPKVIGATDGYKWAERAAKRSVKDINGEFEYAIRFIDELLRGY